MHYATLGFDVKPRLGLLEMVWVTAKQSNNKARGRAAHPGAIRSITASTLKGLHSLEENKKNRHSNSMTRKIASVNLACFRYYRRTSDGNIKGQTQQVRDSQNGTRQRSLRQILSTDVRWVAHEVLR